MSVRPDQSVVKLLDLVEKRLLYEIHLENVSPKCEELTASVIRHVLQRAKAGTL